MGKHLGVVVLLLAMPALAAAQDFGTEWMDRVTHELQRERGPLPSRPFNWNATGGVGYWYDSNVFNLENDEEGSGIIIPFARGRVDYATQRLELEAELLANYKFYLSDDIDSDADDDEERLFLRVRQVDARYSLEFAAVLQNVSDPVDAVFLDRVERLVANFLPRATFDVSKVWTIEGGANLQAVRFDDDAFDIGDNISVRADLSLVYKSPWGFDAVGQAGYIGIEYSQGQGKGAPPDAWGYYVRGGWRGDVLPRLYLEGYLGYTHIESDFFTGTSVDQEDNTVDAAVALRYEATETLTFTADFSRQFTFAIAEPYQIVNRFLTRFVWDLTPTITLTGRFQADHVVGALGSERDYFTLGGALTWKLTDYLVFDGGGSWRSGETESASGLLETEFDGIVVHAGLALTY